MPLVNPTTTPDPTPVVRTVDPEYKNIAVDTRYIPSSSLLTSIEGMSWTVNYYSQVLNNDSALAGQNVSLSAVLQQYRLIKGMELKVTTPLTSDQDEATKIMTLRGTANVYPFLIPNVGDMFVADIGDGRAGIFKITSSERKSIFKDTCYVVEYQLVDYTTALRLGDLNSKVVLTLQFIKDFLYHGQNPLLTDEDYGIAKSLEDSYYDLIRSYFKSYTSRNFKTLLMPGQADTIYDHFLTKTLTSIVTTWQASEVLEIRRLNVDGDDCMDTTTIWDVVLQKDKRLLKHAAKKMGLVSSRTFESNPMMEGVYFSGIAYVVYPKDPEVSIDYERVSITKQVTSDIALQDAPTPLSSLSDLLGTTVLSGLPYVGSPLLTPVLADDYYIFSQAFYDNTEGQSKLEHCVRDYLEGNALDKKLLLAFCDTYPSWGSLERFYYMPFVLMMIKASIRSL